MTDGIEDRRAVSCDLWRLAAPAFTRTSMDGRLLYGPISPACITSDYKSKKMLMARAST